MAPSPQTRRNKGVPPNPTWASPTLGCHGCSTSQNPSALPKGPKNPGTGPATPSPPAKPQVDSPITVRSLHVAQTSHVPVRRVDDARAWTGRAASGSRARPRRWALPRTLRPTVSGWFLQTGGRYGGSCHCTSEKMEAQRVQATRPRSHSWPSWWDALASAWTQAA